MYTVHRRRWWGDHIGSVAAVIEAHAHSAFLKDWPMLMIHFPVRSESKRSYINQKLMEKPEELYALVLYLYRSWKLAKPLKTEWAQFVAWGGVGRFLTFASSSWVVGHLGDRVYSLMRSRSQRLWDPVSKTMILFYLHRVSKLLWQIFLSVINSALFLKWLLGVTSNGMKDSID